ncbi:MAG: PKD domain-containing protein [Lewinella sp.]|nr:PKD domain-containing protein [Lewinella sp.]
MKTRNLLLGLVMLAFAACEIYPELAPMPSDCDLNANFMLPGGTTYQLSEDGVCQIPISTGAYNGPCELLYRWTVKDSLDQVLQYIEDENIGSITINEPGVYEICLTMIALRDTMDQDMSSIGGIEVFPAGQAPIPVIEVDSTSGFGPCTFTFYGASSLNEEAYRWDFGDGTTSTDQTVTHTFAPSDGVYKVRLWASNSNFGESTQPAEVEIRANWRRLGSDYSAQDLGPAYCLLSQDDDPYVVVGREIDSPYDPYFATINRDGSVRLGPCSVHLDDRDRIEDAVMLSENQVIAIGKTKNPAGNDDNVLFWSFNPKVSSCSDVTPPTHFGDLGIDERGKAIIAITNGFGNSELVIISEVYSSDPHPAGTYQIRFGRHGLSGIGLDEDYLSVSTSIEDLIIEDVIQAPNGDYWICGAVFPLNASFQEGYLLHISSSGGFIDDSFFPETGADIALTTMALNQSGTHLLVYGHEDGNQMVFARISLTSGTGNLQHLSTSTVKSPRDARLLDNGQVLVGGGGAAGCTLQLMDENGAVSAHESYGTVQAGFFSSVIPTMDGGYAAAGNQNVRVYFVKTDNNLAN